MFSYKDKILMTMLISLFFIFSFPLLVQANTPQKIVNSQISKLGLEDIKAYWDNVVTEYGGFLPESQKGTFYEFVSGEKNLSIKEMLNGLLRYLFHEILANGKLLSTLILLTVFSAILQSFQNAFERHAISKVAYAIIYMVLIIIALNSFHVAISYAQIAITNMMSFIIALMPLILAIMASTGNVISVAFFHPLIIFLVSTSGLIIKNFVFPLLFLSAILSIVSTMTEHYKVTQLAQLLRNISIGALGVFITVFLGVLSVQGATTAVADGITVRTAKFVTGNFIPVIGRMFTEATDTVLTASILLKNTVGIIGVSILLLMAAFPAIKVLSLALIYKIAAAILQPLGGGPIIECLSIISKSVIYIFAALAVVSLMFFLTITIIISAGNISIMMR
jgi:stage III sporulation protein AE